MASNRLPHPIPYQGSKRQLADRILSVVEPQRYRTLYEPFAGSAAIAIAAASRGIAEHFVISDTLEPLCEVWSRMLTAPEALAEEYEDIWTKQLAHPAQHFLETRAAFNRGGGAAELLYLLARCVKNSPRFNNQGEFNQSPDHRRLGMRPAKMRREITGAAAILSGRTTVMACDFTDALAEATPSDLVYLDPPWEGTSVGTDKRYRDWLSRERLVSVLEDLDGRGVPYLLSYDGRHGSKAYGEWLPDSIGAARLELPAGRSSQATLSGRSVETVESLYVSRHVTAQPAIAGPVASEQLGFAVDAA